MGGVDVIKANQKHCQNFEVHEIQSALGHQTVLKSFQVRLEQMTCGLSQGR